MKRGHRLFSFLYKPDFQIPATGIDKIEEVFIAGTKQKLLIQSYHPDNPILLFLHGGPSMPLPGISSRGKDYTVVTNTKNLVQHFTVVFWDQRGTGKSYNKEIHQETMNFEQLVSDANEITDYLLENYNKKKIFLAAHSFGTLIGIYLVNRYPEKFFSYVGLSQIISWTENDRLSYNYLIEEAEKRNDLKALKELGAVGEPPYTESYKQWGVLRKWQMKYSTMIYSDEQIKHPGFTKIMLGMLISKDYRFIDVVNTLYKGFKLIYSDEFIKSIPSIDVQKEVSTLQVPVTFIHGKKDVHVHPEPLLTYVKNMEENKPRIIWTEKSSHLFHPEDTRVIEQILIEELKHQGCN